MSAKKTKAGDANQPTSKRFIVDGWEIDPHKLAEAMLRALPCLKLTLLQGGPPPRPDGDGSSDLPD